MKIITPKSYPQGIIGRGYKAKKFEFMILSKNALEIFNSEVAKLTLSQQRSASRALLYFECFLNLIGHPPIESIDDLQGEEFWGLQRKFYGALNSRCFLDAEYSYSGRRRIILYFFYILEQILCRAKAGVINYKDYDSYQVKECVHEFETTPINVDLARKISGWKVAQRNGETIRLKMDAIFEVLGGSFASELYRASQRHALTKSHYGNYSNIVSRFDDFVSWYSHKGDLCISSLQDPSFVHRFFWAFQRWHFESFRDRSVGKPTERVLANLQRQWIRIITWAKSVLVLNKLMCLPLGDVWPQGSKKLSLPINEVGHHRYANGENIISQKLLTKVPIHVTDKVATEILFKQIKFDFDKVVSWARNQICCTERRLSEVSEVCDYGCIVSPGYKISDSKYGEGKLTIVNLIRAIKKNHHGFLVVDNNLIGKWANLIGEAFSLSDLAFRMALPTKYTIAPIALWLVAKYPILTDSSLLECELFDKNGKRTGYISTDSGHVLVVQKNRKGKQQEIVLSDEAASVVELLIEITTPVRKYLKERGDNGWRRLFIVAGGTGFQKPYVFKSQVSFASIIRQKKFVADHGLELGELINVLSLARLRATSGVLVYLETLSVDKMAEALGNTKRVSLNHYLPSTIHQFFQERWVRIFQNALIVHALNGSSRLLEATDFDSLDELDSFLKVHAIQAIPDECLVDKAVSLRSTGQNSEIIISIDQPVLELLMSLKDAVQNVGSQASGIAMYWSEFAQKLESHIESKDFYDPYIKSCLEKARALADPKRYEAIICE